MIYNELINNIVNSTNVDDYSVMDDGVKDSNDRSNQILPSHPSHLLISQLASISVSNGNSSDGSSTISTRSSSPALGTLLPFLKKRTKSLKSPPHLSSISLSSESISTATAATAITCSSSSITATTTANTTIATTTNNAIPSISNDGDCNINSPTPLSSIRIIPSSSCHSPSSSSPMGMSSLYDNDDNIMSIESSNSSSPIRTPLKEISVNIRSEKFKKIEDHFAHWSLRKQSKLTTTIAMNKIISVDNHRHDHVYDHGDYQHNDGNIFTIKKLNMESESSERKRREAAKEEAILDNPRTTRSIDSSDKENEKRRTTREDENQNNDSNVIAINANLTVNDVGASYHLPSFQSPKDAIRRIDSGTMISLIEGQFSSLYDNLFVIDCRYPYEYSGGHLPSAINICTLDAIEKLLFNPNQEIKGRSLLVFHCEFSSERAPRMALHVRNYDRVINGYRYPFLFYPEVYVMDGGYKKFFELHPNRTEPPQSYRPMRHPNNKEELRLHQKMKSTTTINTLHGGGNIGKHGKKLRSFSLGLELSSKEGTTIAASIRAINGMAMNSKVGGGTTAAAGMRVSEGSRGLDGTTTFSSNDHHSLLFSECPPSASSSSSLRKKSFTQQHVPIMSSDCLAAFLSSDGPEICSNINYQMDISFD